MSKRWYTGAVVYCIDIDIDAGGSANRPHMLFDFMLNGWLMLALARRDPEPIIEALRDTPEPAGRRAAGYRIRLRRTP